MGTLVQSSYNYFISLPSYAKRLSLLPHLLLKQHQFHSSALFLPPLPPLPNNYLSERSVRNLFSSSGSLPCQAPETFLSDHYPLSLHPTIRSFRFTQAYRTTSCFSYKQASLFSKFCFLSVLLSIQLLLFITCFGFQVSVIKLQVLRKTNAIKLRLSENLFNNHRK